MKKLLSLIIITLFFAQYYPTLNTAAEDTWNYFVVTAYYSPLPDQDYYITGNYEDEKILNGQWIAGASWRKVFSWMLAAPGKYNFGTKIYLDGLWVGVVEDRWWAIVEAGNRWYSHDRIDIWVWHGDEWLRRAMFWGKRKVYGNVIDSSSEVNLDYTKMPSPEWVTKWLKKAYKKPTVNIFNTSVNKYSETWIITELQEVLVEIWYLEADTQTGIYDAQTIDAVYNFQMDNKIIDSEFSQWAWSYWPKTREMMEEYYTVFLEEKAENEAFFAKIDELQKVSYEQASTDISELNSPKYWDISPEVRELQKKLADLGYFTYKDTAIFGVKTQNAILSYQLEREIITTADEKWAWIFGPKTQSSMIEDIANIYLTDLLEQEWLLAKYNDTYNSESESDEINISFESITYKI